MFNRRRMIIVGAIVVVLILMIWTAIWIFTPTPTVAKKPTPVSTTQTSTVKEYAYVFDVGLKPSNVWVFPTNTKGWILTWNADDLTVPYEVITEHGSYQCIPGGMETEIGPTRTIAFRALSDTATTKIRAVLRKP